MMSKDEPLLSNKKCQLERADPSRDYARVPGHKKKEQEKDKKRNKYLKSLINNSTYTSTRHGKLRERERKGEIEKQREKSERTVAV